MIKSTEDITVNMLFRVQSPFRVPIYQRGYDWDRQRIKELVDDIYDLFAQHQEPTSSEKNSRMTHFFGGLVAIAKPVTHRLIKTEHEIVDGQQRLTTWFITIWLIVDAFKKLASEAAGAGLTELRNDAETRAALYEAQLLKYEDIEGGQKKQLWRLRLSKFDQPFFERLLERGVRANERLERDSHRKLRYAHKTIQDEIIVKNALDDRWSIPIKLNRLQMLTDCLLHSCFAVLIVSDDESEAYRLFATLNDRGKPLSTGDLLRARTLELLEGHPSVQAQAMDHWMMILRGKETEVDAYLNAYYTAETGDRAPKRSLYHQIREKFFKYKDISQDALGDAQAKAIGYRIQSMHTLSAVFDDLSRGSWPYSSSEVSAWDRDRLFRLVNVLEHTLALPLLLAIYDVHDERLLSETVNLIERFVFRYITIVGEHEGRLAAVYGKHIKLMRHEPSGFKLPALREELKALQDQYASDTLFRGNLPEKLRYQEKSSAQKKRIKHFLTTVEDYWSWLQGPAQGNPVPNKMSLFDLGSGAISIEHIYPQNPKSEQVDSGLGNLKHTLGNLSFWGPRDNSKATNLPFSEKVTEYSKSQVQMNRELAKNRDWKVDALLRRQADLVEMGLKLFRV